ncbi:hypothetical protein [Pseudomonas sp.]|uniref:hypothetical protein n=1 Tax=Pseudomonas sp. TaxID=306 RepID=UPI0025863D28|nr:hypothetical protein [Pseudomonas sp.]
MNHKANVAQNSLALNSKAGETDLTVIVKNLIRKAGTSGVIALAPGIAKRIVEELNFAGNRKVRKGRVIINLQLMREGGWEPHVSTIVLCELPDGSLVLINGQHRCLAIVEFDAPVLTKIDIIPARDDEHVRSLYAKYDSKGSVRTEGELVKASGIAEALDLKTKTAEMLLKAVPIIMNGMEPETRGAGKEHLGQFEFRLQHATAWEREAREFDAIADLADAHIKRRLLRAGTMAVALFTLKHQREKAVMFWKGVAENDGLRKTDPRSRLISDFSTRTLNQGSARQAIQQSALAWNAFYEGRELKIIKCIEGAEIIVAGTPMRKGGSK